jgi:hypothetical protein
LKHNGGSLKIPKKLSKRQILALKIFLTLFVVNALLFTFFAPTEVESVSAFQAGANQIEIKVKGELHTSFELGKELTLLNQSGLKIGPANLVKLNEESITLVIDKTLYAQSYAQLSQNEWILLPYISQPQRGSSYEIHY